MKHKVKVVVDKHVGTMIQMTRNGYEWQSMAFENVEEMKAVRAELTKQINKLQYRSKHHEKI